MKSLSQSEYGELRSLYESVYTPKFESILDEFTDEDLDDLTDEYIEEQVTEFFQECLEEGLDIQILEETICESIDASLDILIERIDPAETQRRRDQAKDRLGISRSMKSAAEKSSPKPSLKVSTAKVGSSSAEKKASALSRIKGAVKKVGKAAQGGVGLAARAVGTAQRASSAVKSAAKSGYERGRQGSGTSSTTSSSGSSGDGESTSSPAGSSDNESSTTSTPKKRKDGLLKRGLKKLVRGVGKAVSVGAGAVKAGADYAVSRARKEEFDIFDVVLEFLQAEGYVETLEEAEWMMANLIDEEAVDIILGEALTGERYKKAVKKPGGTAYSRMVSKDPSKRATRGGRGGESDFGAGDRGAGNKAARRAGTYQEEEFGIYEVLDTPEKANEYARKNVRSMLGAFAKGVANKDISQLKTINKRTEGAKRAKRKAERKAAEEQKEAFEAWLDEAMSNYEKNRKRAAQRAAARNAARDAGKTGVVPGVGYVTPRRERETWTDESGQERHTSGARMPKKK